MLNETDRLNRLDEIEQELDYHHSKIRFLAEERSFLMTEEEKTIALNEILRKWAVNRVEGFDASTD